MSTGAPDERLVFRRRYTPARGPRARSWVPIPGVPLCGPLPGHRPARRLRTGDGSQPDLGRGGRTGERDRRFRVEGEARATCPIAASRRALIAGGPRPGGGGCSAATNGRPASGRGCRGRSMVAPGGPWYQVRCQRISVARSEDVLLESAPRLTETTVDYVGCLGTLWSREALTTRKPTPARCRSSGARCGRGHCEPARATPGRHLEVKGVNSPLCSVRLRATATAHTSCVCCLVQPKGTVMSDVLKPPQRRATKKRRKKSWWVRPETFRLATSVVRLVSTVARLIDLLLR